MSLGETQGIVLLVQNCRLDLLGVPPPLLVHLFRIAVRTLSKAVEAADMTPKDRLRIAGETLKISALATKVAEELLKNFFSPLTLVS